MLQNTFLHCPGIGRITEAALWKVGSRTWADFLGGGAADVVSAARVDGVAAMLRASKRALARRDLFFFARHLARSEHWRLYQEFSESAAFVDIETTGLWAPEITVVAVHASRRTRLFVRGRNLARCPETLSRYPMWITFNGACFDLPILQ